MTDDSLGVRYDHLVVHRTVLLWLHLVLALLVCILYLSTLDLSHFKWWRRAAGVIVLTRTSGVMLPYLVGALISRRFATGRWLGVWAYAAIVLGGTGAVAAWYITNPGHEAIATLRVVTLQVCLYAAAALACFARPQS